MNMLRKVGVEYKKILKDQTQVPNNLNSLETDIGNSKHREPDI